MVYLRSLDNTIQISLEDGQNLLVGRLPKCDAVLEDGSVSSQHARLKLKGNHLRVADLGSTNGTRVNYVQVEEKTYLMDGDTVEFGNMTFSVDGPQLELPREDAAPVEPIVDLEPLEEDYDLTATMRNIEVPDEEELAKEPVSPEPAPSATGTTETSRPSRPPNEKVIAFVDANPVWAAFGVAMFLLVLGGILVLTLLWQHPTTFSP